MTPEQFRESCRKKLSRWKIYDTLGEFSPKDVFPHLATYPDPTDRQYEAGGRTYTVNMESLRYFVFRKNPTCVACGVTGTKFLLQRERKNTGRAHFNFYADLSGGLMMMTKDHILPRIDGGLDRLDNLATLCDICNNLKGRRLITNADILKLRKTLEEECFPSQPS